MTPTTIDDIRRAALSLTTTPFNAQERKELEQITDDKQFYIRFKQLLKKKQLGKVR